MLLNTMSRLSFKKTLLLTAGVLSLLAQGMLLLPKVLDATLQSFLPWGSIAIGAAFFAFSIFMFIVLISRQFAKKRLEWRANSILLLTQALTAIGIYLLLDGFVPGERGAAFLLSGLVTVLTTYGIFTHTSRLETSHPALVGEEENLSADFPFDLDANINVLKEQIESLTRQLTAEKHRNTQLTLLNELSQQLEAELDPPVTIGCEYA
jgi:hypothetical protein